MSKDLTDIYNTIKAYFRNDLSPEQSEDLLKHFENNPEAEAMLQDENAIRNLMVEADLINVRAQMQKDLKNKSASKNIILLTTVITTITAIICYFSFKEEAVSSKNLEKTPLVEVSQEKVAVKQLAVQVVEEETVPTVQNTIEIKNTTAQKESSLIEINKESFIPLDKRDAHSKGTVATESITEIIAQANKTVQPTTITVVKNDCASFKPSVKVKVHNYTADEMIGSIEFVSDNIDLMYSLKNETDFANDIVVEVKANTYEVLVMNDKGCIASLGNVIVKQEMCAKDYIKTVAPEQGGEWVIPISSTHECTVEIKNKQYKTVYTFTSQSGDEAIWNGKDKQGAIVPLGLYVAQITYASGEQCIANVNVIR